MLIGRAGFEPELCDDEDCGICLEAELDVSVNGCEHRLCMDCAIRLCDSGWMSTRSRRCAASAATP